jgi:hypothetical protein
VGGGGGVGLTGLEILFFRITMTFYTKKKDINRLTVIRRGQTTIAIMAQRREAGLLFVIHYLPFE